MDFANAKILFAFKTLFGIFNHLFIHVPVALSKLVNIGAKKRNYPIATLLSKL
jgi:hypothetical protein